jgi:hypothetical protein
VGFVATLRIEHFLASSFSSSQTLSTPTPGDLPVTQTVNQAGLVVFVIYFVLMPPFISAGEAQRAKMAT